MHDARVALRRLRGTLTTFHAMLDRRPATSLRRSLAWLAGELGAARDAEVMLVRVQLAVRELEGEPGGDGGEEHGSGALLAHLASRSSAGLARATDALADPRFAALLARLRATNGADLVRPGAGDAGEVEALVRRELEALLGALSEASTASDEELHELRKTAKRLRYARVADDEVDAALRRLQDVLGEHQDSVVAREVFRQLPAGPLVPRLAAREEAAAAAARRRLPDAVAALRHSLG